MFACAQLLAYIRLQIRDGVYDTQRSNLSQYVGENALKQQYKKNILLFAMQMLYYKVKVHFTNLTGEFQVFYTFVLGLLFLREKKKMPSQFQLQTSNLLQRTFVTNESSGGRCVFYPHLERV